MLYLYLYEFYICFNLENLCGEYQFSTIRIFKLSKILNFQNLQLKFLKLSKTIFKFFEFLRGGKGDGRGRRWGEGGERGWEQKGRGGGGGRVRVIITVTNRIVVTRLLDSRALAKTILRSKERKREKEAEEEKREKRAA